MKLGKPNVASLINAAFFIIGVLLLIGPAIQNGFPIIHADSGTYLLEGFGNKIPVSRPLSYCLFVRFTSRAFSIWSTVTTQAMFVFWVTWLTINTMLGKRKIAWIPFTVISILAATTGISFYVSQIMPDIFLPVALMSVFVILTREKLPWYTFTGLGLILWISLIVHMSNLPVVTAVTIAILALKILIAKSFKIIYLRKVIVLGSLIIISWITNPFISLRYKEGFKLSNSDNIVFFSRLLQAGAAQQFIKDKCESDSTYYLCEYKDEIDKYNRLDVFLWTDSSFLYKHPCKQVTWDHCWRTRNKEFGDVNSDILAYPPSRSIYLKAVWHDFLLQLHSFGLTAYVSYKAGSHIDFPIKHYYKNDYKSYKNSRQYNGTMMFSDMNKIIRITVYITLVLILLLFIMNRKLFSLNSPFLMFGWIIVVTWLVNGLLTALLAVVSDRFLGRFIWLVPFLLILMILQEYFRLEGENQNHSTLESENDPIKD